MHMHAYSDDDSLPMDFKKLASTHQIILVKNGDSEDKLITEYVHVVSIILCTCTCSQDRIEKGTLREREMSEKESKRKARGREREKERD